MTSDEQKYFDNFFDLFASEGWKQFVEEAEEELKHPQFDISNIDTEIVLNYRRGQKNTVQRIVNFEDIIRNAYDAAVEADNEPLPE